MSQTTFAKRAGVSLRTVQRWEASETFPELTEQEDIALALDLPLEFVRAQFAGELGADVRAWRSDTIPFSMEHSEGGYGYGVITRRELLRVLSLACGSFAAPVDWQRMDSVTKHAAWMDSPALADLATINGGLWVSYRSLRHKHLALHGVLAQLGLLTSLLADAKTSTQHGALCVLVSDIGQLAGEIAFDTGQYADAVQCYATAANAASDARAYDLRACALVRNSFLSLYDGQPENALGMLRAASDIAVAGDHSLSTRQWVAMVTADAYAGLGDERNCRMALERAEQIRILPESSGTTWLRFTADRYVADQGSCLLKLGRIDLAEPALLEALSKQPEASRRRGMLLADLALAAAVRKDVDHACGLANEVLDIAEGGSASLLLRKIDSVYSALAPHRMHRDVQHLIGRHLAARRQLA